MKFRASLARITACAIALGADLNASNAAEGYNISGPFSHSNLSIYFLHGQSAPGPVPLTLAEALTRKSVKVIETGNVRELMIENRGDQAVFVQMGDIVKGGRQDRVLTRSLLLPPHSGKIAIGSYCVEKARWSRRGGENVSYFASAARMLPSKEAKLALAAMPDNDENLSQVDAAEPPRGGSTGRSTRSLDGPSSASPQGVIWRDVDKTQRKLTAALGAKVTSEKSTTSLQLSLENKKLNRKISEYERALEVKGLKGDDIVGFVFAVNGQINSGDIYPSNGLFKKMWPKLLKAAATEAIGDTKKAIGKLPTIAAIRAFLEHADSGSAQEEDMPHQHRVVRRKGDKAFFSVTMGASDEMLHTNLLAR